jgi:hypothetical protein
MRRVLMLYPVRPFVDWDPDHPQTRSFGYELLKRFWTQRAKIGITEEEFDRRFRLINRLLDCYRGFGYRVTWAMFGEHDKEEKPDMMLWSHVFEQYEGDEVISVGVSYFDHTRQGKYPDESQVLQELGSIEQLIVGGFHKSDCVQRFEGAARELGITVFPDCFLTDEFFPEMLMSFRYDMDAYMLAKGTLDAEMYEDDPEECKRLLFDGRLAGIL